MGSLRRPCSALLVCRLRRLCNALLTGSLPITAVCRLPVKNLITATGMSRMERWEDEG